MPSSLYISPSVANALAHVTPDPSSPTYLAELHNVAACAKAEIIALATRAKNEAEEKLPFGTRGKKHRVANNKKSMARTRCRRERYDDFLAKRADFYYRCVLNRRAELDAAIRRFVDARTRREDAERHALASYVSSVDVQDVSRGDEHTSFALPNALTEFQDGVQALHEDPPAIVPPGDPFDTMDIPQVNHDPFEESESTAVFDAAQDFDAVAMWNVVGPDAITSE